MLILITADGPLEEVNDETLNRLPVDGLQELEAIVPMTDNREENRRKKRRWLWSRKQVPEKDEAKSSWVLNAAVTEPDCVVPEEGGGRPVAEEYGE